VGYLRFDSFTDTATEELEEAFDYLSTQSLDTLVIDMRYNGGGYLNTASILLDKLVRNHDGLTQFRLTWNETYSSYNESAAFETDTNSIDLKSVYILTTQATASASEMVINSLRANALDVDVVTIGETTHGKPVGMSGKIYDGFVYFLVNFVTENADGVSNYFDGFAPTCTANDDITHEQGDPNEEMIQKALAHIDSGSC
jgi:carboxyl-terminal processing protease